MFLHPSVAQRHPHERVNSGSSASLSSVALAKEGSLCDYATPCAPAPGRPPARADSGGVRAADLTALYPRRWEIEITIKEGKTVRRKGRITLRSKKPELVKQEFWGMILAHYLVRKMRAQAALDRKRDPDELSRKGSIEIIKATQTGPLPSLSP